MTPAFSTRTLAADAAALGPRDMEKGAGAEAITADERIGVIMTTMSTASAALRCAVGATASINRPLTEATAPARRRTRSGSKAPAAGDPSIAVAAP
jgi:hypothetical protein